MRHHAIIMMARDLHSRHASASNMGSAAAIVMWLGFLRLQTVNVGGEAEKIRTNPFVWHMAIGHIATGSKV